VKITASTEAVAEAEPTEAPEAPAVEVPDVEWQLTVGGAVGTETTSAFSDLANMDMTLLEDVVKQSRSGDSTHDYEGVLISSLLESAGADSAAEGITATAADGYAATFAMADLPTEAIVALKEDGQWLAEADPESPIQLVLPGLPGNQWVSQLVSITVEGGGAAPAEVPTAEWTLTVDGAVANVLSLDYAELAGMDLTVLENVLKQSQRGESTHTYEGVLLSDLFALASVDGAAATLTATASDGYNSSIPLADLGTEALVALKDDGEWLAEADPESPVELVVPGLSASQWVSMLVSLTLE